MRRDFKRKKTGIFLLAFTLLVYNLFTGIVYAEEVPTKFEVRSEEFSISESGTQIVEIATDEGKWTFTIEDAISETEINPLYSEYWPTGGFDKRIKANFSGTTGDNTFLAHMSARFKGTINPYIVSIASVSEGEFNASVINPTGEKYYEVTKGTATSSEYGAEARYREKYNILGFGQHDMCLYLQVNTDGKATIFMQGIW